MTFSVDLLIRLECRELSEGDLPLLFSLCFSLSFLVNYLFSFFFFGGVFLSFFLTLVGLFLFESPGVVFFSLAKAFRSSKAWTRLSTYAVRSSTRSAKIGTVLVMNESLLLPGNLRLSYSKNHLKTSRIRSSIALSSSLVDQDFSLDLKFFSLENWSSVTSPFSPQNERNKRSSLANSFSSFGPPIPGA